MWACFPAGPLERHYWEGNLEGSREEIRRRIFKKK